MPPESIFLLHYAAYKFKTMSGLLFTYKLKNGRGDEFTKELGDIRGVSYIYGMFYRFGLIEVPDKAKEKMGVKGH